MLLFGLLPTALRMTDDDSKPASHPLSALSKSLVIFRRWFGMPCGWAVSGADLGRRMWSRLTELLRREH